MTWLGPPWENWEHPDWSGETVFILGGGPSLRGFNPDCLRRNPVVAINEAGLTLCPWADVLFWSDKRWVDWNADRIELHKGDMRYTCQAGGIERVPGARYIRFAPWTDDTPPRRIWFHTDPRTIGGHDSGSKCINLVWHTRAACAVLLGFDMHDLPMTSWQDGSFHDRHQEPPLEGQRALFRQTHEEMARVLPAGFEVLNATPGSALTCWPMIEIEDVT